ncbi:MAG: DUF1292 domain-containing protein [Clostridia bacterium]|nr:DUF1292 domain-containing protein [Clostridia bacterium]
MTKTYDDNDGIYNEVILQDEDGNDVRFDHLLTFAYENEHYIALLPIDEVSGIEDDEVLIMKIVKDGNEDTYELITNEVLLNEVFEEFMRLIDEMDDEDEDEEK